MKRWGIALLVGCVWAPSAEASTNCKYESAWEGFPTLSKVKAERMSCTYATALASDYERRWRKHDRPPGKVNAGGPWYYCRYRTVTKTPPDGGDYSYGVIRCARGKRVMHAKLYS